MRRTSWTRCIALLATGVFAIFASDAPALTRKAHLGVSFPGAVPATTVLEVHGRVAGARPTRRDLKLEYRLGQRWRFLARITVTITGKGTFTITWPVGASPRRLLLRVVLVRQGHIVALSHSGDVMVVPQRGSDEPKTGTENSDSPVVASPHTTLTPAEAQAKARSEWERLGSSYLDGFHSGLSAGQCTDYAAAQRPDIIEHVTEWEWAEAYLGLPHALTNWNAEGWATNASDAGLPVGHVPQVGAIIDFQPGEYGAGEIGHVGVVAVINPDGSFVIKEMHAPVLGEVSEREFSSATAQAMAGEAGIAFIYE